MIEQANQILHEGFGTGTVRDIPRQSETPVVKGDDAEGVGESRHLLPPAQMAAAPAVGKDQGRALAVDLVVQLNPVNTGKRHTLLPISDCLGSFLYSPWIHVVRSAYKSRRWSLRSSKVSPWVQ